MAPVKSLFDPVTIGSVTTRNRICIPPMVLYGHGDDSGMVTEAHLSHYEALARGGAGLIIQEATCVTKAGRLSRRQLGLWSEAQVPGLRQLTDRVHAQGCPIFVQLHHAGVVGLGPERLCPDRYEYHGKDGSVMGQKMTSAQIAEVREAFIRAGRRAWEAGYDGVELHGCHSYLLCQFLNRRVNRRTDRYGERPETLLLEVIEGIREKTSPDFVIGVRLGGFEPTLADALEHARTLEQGGVQFFDVSYGFAGEMDKTAPGDLSLPDTVRAADAIAEAVRVPVFAVGGIRLPQDGERVLEQTRVRMVDVGRSALVDPQWPNKAAAGILPGKCLDCRVCQWRIDPSCCPGRKQMEEQR